MKFFCESCGQKLEIEDDGTLADKVECPSCGNETPIPKKEAAASDEALENALRDSLSVKDQVGGMTIAQLMADRNIDGGLQLSTDVLEGDQNRKYEYGAMIAKGGVVGIFSASDLNIRRNVAVKVLLDPEGASNADILRFIEEAQVTGQLEHPSVVPVHDLGVDGIGNVYYTMKMVKGDNLHAILRRISGGENKAIQEYPLSRLLNIYLKVCDAMRFAHSKNVIHRDLKPENIMVGEFGEVLVMDWGLAKVLGQSQDDPVAEAEMIQSVRNQDASGALNTIAGTIFGTPQFMSPEQARGATDQMDTRTDIYSLGAILYNILTLRPPARGTTIDEILTKVSAGDIANPTYYNTIKGKSIEEELSAPGQEVNLYHCPGEKIPNALAAIVMKAMALAREARYQNVDELQSDIEAYQGGFATKAEKAGAMKQASLFVKRNLLGTISAIIISLLGIGFGLKSAVDAREIQRVSVEAAPEFVVKARNALREQDEETAKAAVQTALGLDKNSAEAWYELARLYFDEYDFDSALEALNRVNDLADDPDLIEETDTLRAVVKRWSGEIGKDGKGVLPEHLIKMAPEVQDIDPTLAGRFFSRVGAEQRALRIQVEEAFAELLEVNPGLTWKKAEKGKSWPMGIYQFYWTQIFKETGMELDLAKFCEDPTKLVNLSPLRQLPIKALDLEGTSISDLEPLVAIDTLSRLNLKETPILTLTALEGSNIESLNISNTRIDDLTPLIGTQIKSLNLHQTRITDFSPLAQLALTSFFFNNYTGDSIEFLSGMPLKKVVLNGAVNLESLEPLRSAPIEELEIENCPSIADLSMLQDMPLKTLAIGTRVTTDLSVLSGKELDSLKISMDISNFQSLKRCRVNQLLVYENVSARNLSGLEFQRDHLEVFIFVGAHKGGQLVDINALRGMKRLKSLRLGQVPVRDLSPLKGVPLEQLEVFLPNCASAQGLEGAKLQRLVLGGGFSELKALRNMSTLKELDLRHCFRLKNVHVLGTLNNLEKVQLPEGVNGFESLRGKRKIREIGFGERAKSAQGFWKDFDARKKAKKK